MTGDFIKLMRDTMDQYYPSDTHEEIFLIKVSILINNIKFISIDFFITFFRLLLELEKKLLSTYC